MRSRLLHYVQEARRRSDHGIPAGGKEPRTPVNLVKTRQTHGGNLGPAEARGRVVRVLRVLYDAHKLESMWFERETLLTNVRSSVCAKTFTRNGM